MLFLQPRASQSRRITDTLDEAIVILNPVYNPGRSTSSSPSTTLRRDRLPEPTSYEHLEPGILWGRTNHYRFDMNRDRVAMSQDETRQEVAEFLRWNPTCMWTSTGRPRTTFFRRTDGDQRQRDRAVVAWTGIFNCATGRAFDIQGWTSSTKDVFDLYFPGYLDSWALRRDRHDARPTAQAVARRRADGSILTLRDGIEKHFCRAHRHRSTAQNREALLTDYVSFKSRAVSGAHAGEVPARRPHSPRTPAAGSAQQLLARSGIVSRVRRRAVPPARRSLLLGRRVGRRGSAEGSLVVDMAQSRGPLAKALLEPKPEFERVRASPARRRTLLPRGDLPRAGRGVLRHHGLEPALLAQPEGLVARSPRPRSRPSPRRLPGRTPPRLCRGPPSATPSSTGTRTTSSRPTTSCKRASGSVATKPIQAGRRSYPRGTSIFLRARNEGRVRAGARAGGPEAACRLRTPDRAS